MLALDGLGSLAVPRWSPKVATVPQSGRSAHGAAMRQDRRHRPLEPQVVITDDQPDPAARATGPRRKPVQLAPSSVGRGTPSKLVSMGSPRVQAQDLAVLVGTR